MATVTNKDKFGRLLSVEAMIKRFKKKVQEEGIMADIKKHEAYLKPSIKRKEKSKQHRQLMARLERQKQRAREKYYRKSKIQKKA